MQVLAEFTPPKIAVKQVSSNLRMEIGNQSEEDPS